MRFLLASIAVIAAPAAAYGQADVDGLLAADRAFAAQSAGTGLIPGLTAMFDRDVLLPGPGGTFASGKAAAAAALAANPANATSTVTWAPVRGGVSADGRQGFTFGYMTVTRAGGEQVPVKYLAYWIRRPAGWRVRAYSRAGVPAGAGRTAMLAPALPGGAVTDGDARASVMAAEQAFSDAAQRIGLGPAFAANGRADAMNKGGAPGFTIGAAAIGKELDEGTTTSSVRWAADDALVAASGDLAITWGRIFTNAAPDKAPAAFFTVWKREPGGPWRYIAE